MGAGFAGAFTVVLAAGFTAGLAVGRATTFAAGFAADFVGLAEVTFFTMIGLDLLAGFARFLALGLAAATRLVLPVAARAGAALRFSAMPTSPTIP